LTNPTRDGGGETYHGWGTLTLFSPEPKTRRQDLYDFNRELSALVTALRAERLTKGAKLRLKKYTVKAVP